jgi:hypothetical protein
MKETSMRVLGMLTTGLLVAAGVAAIVLTATSAGDVSRYLRMRRM